MEQIERTRRYLNRIRDIYKQVPYHSDNRERYSDDVYSFFIHCHHIRDWFYHLNIVGITEKDLDSFISAHIELRICEDLCNGTKHCELDKRRRHKTNSQPHIISTSFESDNETTTKGKFCIHSDGIFYDALQLAERCMKLWDDFVDEKKRCLTSGSSWPI